MVRFFNRPQKASKDAKDIPAPTTTSNGATSSTDEKPPGPPARKRATTTRRAPARPARRDWAAEAAALPIDAPAPAASSIASSPSEDSDAGATTKRRRGTRGGRGRKKPGATDAVAAPPAPAKEAAKAPAKPLTIEDLLSQQSQVLERFAKDVTASIQGLQQTVADLQGQMADRPAMTSHPRVGIFVDVPNVIYAAERRNVTIDFGRVLNYFTRNRELVRASAYAPITDDPQAKLESQRFVHQFLGHPYRIITKPLKRFADGSMKANFDIELAIDILTMSDRLDVVVLMSGDGDFRRLVELIASRGVRVEVVAFGETASAELKTVADLYIDIGAHLDEFKAQK